MQSCVSFLLCTCWGKHKKGNCEAEHLHDSLFVHKAIDETDIQVVLKLIYILSDLYIQSDLTACYEKWS